MRKPKLVRPAAAVALGIVTTVSVAWGLSRQDGTRGRFVWGTTDRVTIAGRERTLQVNCAEKPGVRVWFSQALPPGPRFPDGPLFPEHTPPESLVPTDLRDLVLPWIFAGRPWPSANADTVMVYASGWPLLAMATIREPNIADRWSRIISVPALASSPQVPPGFPATPLPIGFAVNASLAAAVWSLMLCLPAPLRRAIRHRRGHCQRCGYDLKHDVATGCPECGWNHPAAASA